MTTTNRTADELLVHYLVEGAFDRGRCRGYLDLGGSRRASALRRLERQARDQARAEGYPGLTAVEWLEHELVRAFERMAYRRLAKARRGSHVQGAATRNALRRAAAELDEDRDSSPFADALERAGVVGLELERVLVRTDRNAARAGRPRRTVEA